MTLCGFCLVPALDQTTGLPLTPPSQEAESNSIKPRREAAVLGLLTRYP